MPESNIHPVVCFGETLWDVLPSGKQAGGAPMNVAYHLHKLGKNPAIISRVGFDDLGKQLIETLETKGVCTDFFQMDYDKPTSVVTATPKNKFEMMYTIVEDVAWDYIEPEPDSIHLVQEADYFVYGSLAARNRKTFNTLLCLLEVAQKKVLDVNLRSPFYNRALLEMLLSKANILKMNIEELELITGWFSPIANERDRIKLLKERFDLHAVIVTCGAKGAIMNVDDEWCHCNGLAVPVADTVGSGDSFLAGVLHKWLERAPAQEALDFANKLAAFVATQRGACPDYNPTELFKDEKSFHLPSFYDNS